MPAQISRYKSALKISTNNHSSDFPQDTQDWFKFRFPWDTCVMYNRLGS